MGLSDDLLRHATTIAAPNNGTVVLLATSSMATAPAAASADADNSLLPFVPRWLKLVLLLLLVLNARSFPGVWHVRLWTHAVLPQIRAKWRGMLPHLRRQHELNGSDPFRLKSTRSLWAGPDDCDCEPPPGSFKGQEELADTAAAPAPVNLHLSNSCYAKHCDASRMKVSLFVT